MGCSRIDLTGHQDESPEKGTKKKLKLVVTWNKKTKKLRRHDLLKSLGMLFPVSITSLVNNPLYINAWHCQYICHVI